MAKLFLQSDKKTFVIKTEQQEDSPNDILVGKSSMDFCDCFADLHEMIAQKRFKFSPKEIFHMKEDFEHFKKLYKKEIKNGEFKY